MATPTQRKTPVALLFKNRASNTNKELLAFLHRNIHKMRVHFNIKAVIVNNDNKPNHKLPAMRLKKKTVIGLTAIMNELKKMYLNAVRPKSDTDRVRDYFIQQMSKKDEDDTDRQTSAADQSKKRMAEVMRNREAKAANKPRSNERNNQRSRGPPKHRSTNNISKSKPSNMPTSNADSTDPTGPLPSDSITDPLLKKFWANKGL